MRRKIMHVSAHQLEVARFFLRSGFGQVIRNLVSIHVGLPVFMEARIKGSL